MPDSTINGLTALAAASVVPGTDVLPIWQGSASTTKKITVVDTVTAGNTFGTIAASTPATISQTWNNAGVTFTAKLISVTDTLSASGSLLQDWQVGGSSKASIKKDGSISAVAISTSGNASGVGGVNVSSGGNRTVILQAGSTSSTGVYLGSNGGVQWCSAGDAAGTTDLSLFRDAANVLAQKNAANAQEYRVYKNTTGTQYKSLVGDGNLIKISGYAFTNGAAAAVGTLTNAPAAGNPTKWIPIDDNGTTRYIPAW